MSTSAVLAIIGGLLFVLSLVPQLDSRLGSLGGILLAISIFLIGRT